MDAQTSNLIIEGLITYLGLIILLTFHEFGHAWVALKCGDPTAQMMGRVTLNPIKHIDPIGTVVLPLIMIFASPAVGQFLVGWAKPVPINVTNFRNPKFDDILVAMAGPAMNLILAVFLVGLARIGLLVNVDAMVSICIQMAALSLLLCFFNLIPIPPLDGSHVLRNLIGMSYETYWHLSRFGFIAVIVVLQIPFVRAALGAATYGTLSLIAYCFGFPTG
ncbi:MAG: site-2 protease family protein [Limisphaerales bacterium]